MQKNSRIMYIDLCKGLGILMVTLGHITTLANPVDMWMSSMKLSIFLIRYAPKLLRLLILIVFPLLAVWYGEYLAQLKILLTPPWYYRVFWSIAIVSVPGNVLEISCSKLFWKKFTDLNVNAASSLYS